MSGQLAAAGYVRPKPKYETNPLTIIILPERHYPLTDQLGHLLRPLLKLRNWKER